MRERVHKTALNALVLDPQCLKGRSFFTGCGPQYLPFAQNPVCRCPRLLNTPKNARRILPQAPAARRRIASTSLITAGGLRAYLPNRPRTCQDPAVRFARRGPSVLRKDFLGVSPGPPAVTREAEAIRLLAASAWGRMRRAFLGVFSSRGCLHTGFWAKGGRYGSRSVKNGQLLRRWGSESGLPALFCASDPAPADSGMLKTPEFARRPLGYLQAKSNRPAEICNRRGGLW